MHALKNVMVFIPEGIEDKSAHSRGVFMAPRDETFMTERCECRSAVVRHYRCTALPSLLQNIFFLFHFSNNRLVSLPFV